MFAQKVWNSNKNGAGAMATAKNAVLLGYNLVGGEGGGGGELNFHGGGNRNLVGGSPSPQQGKLCFLEAVLAIEKM